MTSVHARIRSVVAVLLAATAIGSLQGCDIRARKMVTLRVVEQTTHHPIEGAKVHVQHFFPYFYPFPTLIGPPTHAVEGVTDSHGLVELKIHNISTEWNLDARPTHAYGPIGDGIAEGGFGPVDTGRVPYITKTTDAVHLRVIDEPGVVDDREYQYTVLVPRNAANDPAPAAHPESQAE